MMLNNFDRLFENRVLLITGGTGSFGNAVVKRLLTYNLSQIRILSRDEKKQDDMRKSLKDDRLHFFIGDVKDFASIDDAFRNVDFVFHAAALKQVPSCEFFPIEATKTNVFGTENVLRAAIRHGVQRLICLSTDKAVYPINAMGISKAMMEKVAIANARYEVNSNTTICITRYGNVMGSRGSVIPLFYEQIKSELPLSITDPAMTRFMMTLDEAVELVLFAFKNGNPGDLFVQKSPAATIETLVEAIKIYTGRQNYSTKVIGTRHGEKLYEVLLSKEEFVKSVDLGNFYQVAPDFRSLNYDHFFTEGKASSSVATDYNSHNTYRLSVDEMIELLHKI